MRKEAHALAFYNSVKVAVDASVGCDGCTTNMVGRCPPGENPAGYASSFDGPASFMRAYLSYNLLRKLELKGEEERLKREAIDRFKAIEKQNERNNRHLRLMTREGVEGILSDAKRKISSILGRFDLDEFASHVEWGPGATATIVAENATRDKKILEPKLSVTPRAVPYMRYILENAPLWLKTRWGVQIDGPVCVLPVEFNVIHWERFDTVPKDVTARRTIGIQPSNLLLQKAIGTMIRHRLRRIGIDLNDRTRNQKLASLAGVQSLCTVDLKDASNTLISELVQILVPDPWLQVLRDLRAEFIDFGDKGEDLHYLQLFSAMGNGFTFELQSLIFYALLFATIRMERQDSETPIAVFGDDLIFGSSHYERVKTVLTETGFTVNDHKSFSVGPFRESCGAHYFEGCEVTPAFQKKADLSPWTLIRFHNRLYRWYERYRVLDPEGVDLHRPLQMIREKAEEAHKAFLQNPRRRLKLPEGLPLPTQPPGLEGDFGLIDGDFVWKHVSKNGIGSFFGYQQRAGRKKGDEGALLVWAVKTQQGKATRRQSDWFQSQCTEEVQAQYRFWAKQARSRVETLEGVPSYGFVTPRGVVSNVIRRIRVYVPGLRVV